MKTFSISSTNLTTIKSLICLKKPYSNLENNGKKINKKYLLQSQKRTDKAYFYLLPKEILVFSQN